MQWWADWLDEKVECSTLTTIEDHKALQSSAKLCVSQFCFIGNYVFATMQESIPISIR